MKIRKTVIALVIWFALQLLGGVLYNVGAAVYSPESAGYARNMGNMLAIGLLISQIIELLAFWGLKYFKPAETVRPFPGWKTLAVSLPLGFACLYGVNVLTLLTDAPDLLADEMKQMCQSAVGILSIAVLGPISEEVLMRRIILRDMEAATGSAWGGILISAAIFAIIHFNPAQILFAFPAGVLLGWLYCKTGSLLTPICVHMLNNSSSVIVANMGLDDATMTFDMEALLAVAVCAAISVPLVMWLNRRYPSLKSVK